MRQLIKRLPRAGLLTVGTFLVLAVALLLSPTQAEAGGGWCYYHPQQIPGTQVIIYQGGDCQTFPDYRPVTFAPSIGFSSGIALLALSSQNGWIYTNGSYQTDCWWNSTPTMGQAYKAWSLPTNSVVTGIPPCPGNPVVVPAPVTVNCNYQNDYCQLPRQYPPDCGPWNKWCTAGSPLPAPQYEQVAGCLSSQYIATYVGGDYRYWSVIGWSNGTGLKYSGPAANMTGPSQGRVDVNTSPWNIRNGQVAYSVTEATYWCFG